LATLTDNPGMSLPRAIIPGRQYLVTRRCSERRFLMRPDRETNNAFVYCMALAARKSGVSVVCVGTTSNHYHAVVVDNQGRLPEFLEHFHKLFAKHQNCLRGRWEAFWASEQTSVVELPNPEDVLAKMTYTIANPCSSHLVDRVHVWPGVESLTAIEGDVALVARKPSRFFDKVNGDLPAVVQLAFRRAPGFEDLSHDEYARLVRCQVDQAVARAAEERREKGIKLVGRKAVLRQHWSQSPNTREPRRGLSPRVACRNKWARIEALQRNRAFLDQYRAARADHLAGHDAIFPPGTWWLRRYAGLCCAELGGTAPPS
jgi:putative transposase